MLGQPLLPLHRHLPECRTNKCQRLKWSSGVAVGEGSIGTDVHGGLTGPGGKSRDLKSPNQAHHGTDKGEKLAWSWKKIAGWHNTLGLRGLPSEQGRVQTSREQNERDLLSPAFLRSKRHFAECLTSPITASQLNWADGCQNRPGL